jgi:hypothetical protein
MYAPLSAERGPQCLGMQHPPLILRDCGFDEMFAGSSQIMWAHSQIIWVRAESYSHVIWA